MLGIKQEHSNCPKCGYPIVTNNIGKNPPGQYFGLYIPSHGCDNCGYQDQEALTKYKSKLKESEERVAANKKANKEKIDGLAKPFRKIHQ
jgi:C4-type Zn-finger protein